MQNLAFASHIDSLLEVGAELFVQDANRKMPLFQSKLGQECFRQQYADYRKLIRRK